MRIELSNAILSNESEIKAGLKLIVPTVFKSQLFGSMVRPVILFVVGIINVFEFWVISIVKVVSPLGLEHFNSRGVLNNGVTVDDVVWVTFKNRLVPSLAYSAEMTGYPSPNNH